MGDKAMYPKAGGAAMTAPLDVTEPVSRIVREELRCLEDELRAELRQQSRRRTVKLHGAAAAAALYGGAALAVAVGLLFALVMPAWAAFLLVAVALFAAAAALRNAARTRPPRTPEASRTAAGTPESASVPPGGPAPAGHPPRTAADSDPLDPHHRT